MTSNGAGDVDQMHHRAAENKAERIRVVWQDDLDGLGRRVLPPFRLQCLCQFAAFDIRSSLRSRSSDTRYGLRNLCPTMPPTWKPSSTLGAWRFSTTTAKF